MELYDKKYVYFDWDDKLEGKKVILAHTIENLKEFVNSCDNEYRFFSIQKGTNLPFSNGACDCEFAYYDPYYEIRRAYLEGKQLQFKNHEGDWEDVIGAPLFDGDEYRIKPSKIYYAVWNANNIYCDVEVEDRSKVLFYSDNKNKVDLFIESHQYLHDVIKGWFEGKTVQFRCIDKGIDCEEDKLWNTMEFDNNLNGWDFVNYEYRIKPNEIKYIPFDTVQELIDCWDSKHPSNINRPSDTMPLIWIKSRNDGSIYLITEFYPKKYNDTYDVSTTDGFLSFEKLFHDFTFLNDSIIGKVEE